MTDINSGLALGLSGADDGTLHAWDSYRGPRQQVRTVVPLFSLGTEGADKCSFLLSAVVMTACRGTHAPRCIA